MGHLARDCPDRGSKRAFGAVGRQEYVTSCVSYAYGCCEEPDCPMGSYVLGAYDDDDDAYAPDYESDQDQPDGTPDGNVYTGGVSERGTGQPLYGILDGGASSTCASFEVVQLIADSWEPLHEYPEVESCRPREFTFAGGEQSSSKTRVWMPNDNLDEGIGIHVVPCTSTPLLLGTDMLRYYGLVLDYAHNTAYSYRLKRDIPVVILKSGHLAIRMTPPEDDKY